MKTFFIILLLFFATVVSAKNYYIAASGNDSNDGLTATTPWQSIAKVNAFSNKSGDSILFKSGDMFFGTILPNASGIVYSAYGTGAKPTITGLITVSSWTNLGGNIWEADVPGGLSTLSTVVLNGALISMGRFPNYGTTNDGYLTFDNFVGNKSLTSSQLTGSPNWTGAEIVIRRQGFTTDRAQISNHTGNTITYNTSATSTMYNGFGFFIQNSAATLDSKNEWYYYDANGVKKIKMYSNSNPGTIQVSTLTNLVNMNYTSSTIKSNITFTGINFQGCEGNLMTICNSNYLTVDNCNFSFAGINAIEYKTSISLTIKNSIINDVNMCGIYENYYTGVKDVLIKNNTIKRVGLNAGMIAPVSASYPEGNSSTGIIGGSDNYTVQENILDSTGFNGIALRQNRNNTLVRKNTVSNFCIVKNDGGGIYNVGQRGNAPAANVVIDSNIVFKSVGATGGTNSINDKHVKGIYLDATSQNVNVLHNTVFDCFIGISISEAQNNVIKYNTVYNTGVYNSSLNFYAGQLNIDDGLAGFVHCSGNTITNNVFFAKAANQLLNLHNDNFNRIDSIGFIDSNIYANPLAEMPLFMTNSSAASRIITYSLPQWDLAFPKYNKHSKGTPIKIPQFTYTTLGLNKAPNESFTSNITGASASSSPIVHTLTWDNSSQITGTGSAKLTSTITSSTNFTSFYEVIGAIDASKQYVLKFKTKSTKLGSFKTYLQQWSGTYAILTSTQTGSIDTSIQQHEIAFSGEHSTQGNAAIYIQFSQDNGTIYLDDVQFYEATITPTNMDNQIRFEYNSTNYPKTIALDAMYLGLDSIRYNGVITLPAFSSAILLKSGLIQTSLKADAGADINLVLPTNSTVLKGSTNSVVTNYSWTKVSGPSQFTIANPGNPSTVISNLVLGTYIFQLKVINAAGDSALATVRVITTGVLPVKLIDFTGKDINEKIALQWKVASEINVSNYTIERSSDGHVFENIGKLNANNLFNIQMNYNFVDNFPLSGISYYRLVMIDNDGSITYSKVISISIKNAPGFTLNNISISTMNSSIKLAITSNYAQTMNLVLVDVSGRIIFTNPINIQKGFNAFDEQIKILNMGIFYAKLFNKDQIITRTVLANR